MKDDRLRVPIDEPYLRSVGLAVICFARLEWDAVWCCEKIQPGYISGVGSKTAGQIANDLVGLAAGHPLPAVIASLGPPTAEFKRLVGRRNDLMHANPATAPNGDQRLFRKGAEWTIAMIDDVADEFVAAGGPLNHHHHNVL
jgi:hypothetical protein